MYLHVLIKVLPIILFGLKFTFLRLDICQRIQRNPANVQFAYVQPLSGLKLLVLERFAHCFCILALVHVDEGPLT